MKPDQIRNAAYWLVVLLVIVAFVYFMVLMFNTEPTPKAVKYSYQNCVARLAYLTCDELKICYSNCLDTALSSNGCKERFLPILEPVCSNWRS